MADVHPDNQRLEAVTNSAHKKEISIVAHDASDNQRSHDDVSEDTEMDVERRLTWIGEGLLDGEGLEAVQQFMNLPPSPQKSVPGTPRTEEEKAKEADEPPVRIERSGSKLLDFLAKEEGYKPDAKPTVAAAARPPPPARPDATSAAGDKRQNKLLDFLASDVGERYLDNLYQEDSDGEESNRGDATKPEETTDNQACKAANTQNNRLQAFLARERGERVHAVEKTSSEDGEPRRPDPHRVSISIVTPEMAAEALASEATARVRSTSPEPTPEVTQPAAPEDAGRPHAQARADRNKLVDFVKNAQPPSRPKFVLFSPEDLVSSSSGSETEDGASPTGDAKDFRLKRSKQDASRVRFANPGLDVQSGVIRQAVTDHYGREELLDFVAEVDMSPALPRSQRSADSDESSRRESPTLRRDLLTSLRQPSPQLSNEELPASARKSDGRLVTFLRKFSSKSKATSETGGSQRGSRSNSPDISIRHSAPPSAHQLPPEPFKPAPFIVRPTTQAEQGSTPVEETMMSNRSSSGQRISESDPSKRTVLLTSLRQLLEDCEKHELSDISMMRMSILLSTVNQIVRDDVQKERPAQSTLRRVPSVASTGSSDGSTASWVRSSKEQEEYERGHTTTTSDIAHRIEKKSKSPEARVLSPQLSLHPVNAPIAEDAMTAFTLFETAQNMVEIIHAYNRLLDSCGISEAAARTPLHVYNHIKSALYNQFSFRQKQLFRLLNAKLSVDVYKRQPCLHKRVCVVGAGPVGLRAAVELALLGGQVVVIEKRKMFNRENILHLWPWVVQDLTSLGAKVFFPQFCHSSAYFHVGTRQLQCILLKVALLMGVKVYPGTSFEGLVSPDTIVSDRKPFYSVATKPQMPWQEFTAVLGACGTKDKLNAHAGIKRFVFSRKEAIGLVCYFPNLGTNDEKKVNEFSWTIQFKQRLFAKMRDIGIDLENVVYYRGEYHYIVMTPKRTNLLQQGVLKINYPSVADLVAVDNVDPGALNDYVSRIINFFEIPQKSEFARVRLFDFSTRTRAAQAANVLASRGKKLYVGLIGDALMEPFWPEGLGTCRGFLSAMDACWMVSQIGKLSDEQILADRELGYRIVQHISGFQRDDLQKNVRKYNVDPSSRYTIQYPTSSY